MLPRGGTGGLNTDEPHESWLNGLRSRYPGVRIEVDEGDGVLVLSRIAVPPERRGQGVGTAVVREVLARADALGVPVGVTPDDLLGGSVPRLRKFYTRLGFVRNRGRNKDFALREAYVRKPRQRS